MNAAFRAAGIAEAGDYQADASRDIELGVYRNRERNASRASLPYSHRRSQSIASRAGGASEYNGYAAGGPADHTGLANEGEGATEETEWGPLHPCFPHANPHVPESSVAFDKTRIIRVRRDYLMTRELVYGFSRTYPEILEPVLAESQFREVVDYINDVLWRALYPFSRQNMTDRVISYLTANVYDDLGLTNTKRELAHLEKWLEHWNKVVGKQSGVKVISLQRTAYLNLDFQIPDPQISTDAADTQSIMSAPNETRQGTGPARSTYSGTDADGDVHQPVPPIPGKFKADGTTPLQEKL